MSGKKNQDSIRKFSRIDEYLKPYHLKIITDLTSADTIIQQLKNKSLLGIDIETSKKTNHEKAGLIPKISDIRLIQLFDGTTVYIFDCKIIGSLNWVSSLNDTHLIAHNASFEAQHFYHIGIEFNNLDCSMLMGRVFLNKNLSLADMAKDSFDLELDKSLQVSNWNRDNLLPEQYQYAALDAVVTYQLHKKFTEWFQLYKDDAYLESYQFLRKLIYPLVHQQAHGIQLDIDAHNKIITDWKNRLGEVKKLLAQDGLDKPDGIKQKQTYLMQNYQMRIKPFGSRLKRVPYQRIMIHYNLLPIIRHWEYWLNIILYQKNCQILE